MPPKPLPSVPYKDGTQVRTMERFHGRNFVALFDLLKEGAYCVDRKRNILHWNPAAEKITGYAASEVVGSHCFDNILQHTAYDGTELCNHNHTCPLFLTMQDGISRTDSVSLLHKDGRRVPVTVKTFPISNRAGDTIGALELFDEDIGMDSLRQELEDYTKMAHLDCLTGLPNRRYIDFRLKQCIEEWERYGWPFACFVSDIDRFKNINDTFGHDVGDQAICIVLNTIAKACRTSDEVGRWGGDEAVGIIKNADPEHLVEFFDRLYELVRHTRVGGESSTLSATISLGATIVRHGDTPQSILKRADEALYCSKQNGRDRYTIV